MSQDLISDALNQIMNAKKARKDILVIKRHSKLLLKVLDIVRDAGYIDYSIKDKDLIIHIIKLNEFKAIKPRYTVTVKRIDYYKRRFLPAKNFGFIIISTNNGLMKHDEAEEKNIGGCLVAYVF